jgi:hypothetical protein
MKTTLYCLLLVWTTGFVGGAVAGEPKDHFGQPDKIIVEIAPQTTPGGWELGVYLENDEPLAAITVPLLFGDRVGQFHLDSVVFTNTRTHYFGLRTTNSYDTVNSVLIGLLYTLGGDELPLEPGTGPVAWVYLTSRQTPPQSAKPPRIDSTFFPPFNTLELVTPSAVPIRPIFKTVIVEKLSAWDKGGKATSAKPRVQP